MRWSPTVCLVLFLLLLIAPMGSAQSKAVIDCFEEKTFQYTGGKYKNEEIKYRLHTPKTIQPGQKYPFVVFLHGRGRAGSNNTSSLAHLEAILPMLTGQKQKDFFMLVTQCPEETPTWFFQPTKDGTLDVMVAIMEHVIAENPIDEKRITATGVSSGGAGVWELIMGCPDVFAGAVPTACSAPQSQGLAALKQTPIWSVANRGDPVIDFNSIRKAMNAVNSSGGSMASTAPNSSDHNAWIPAMKNYNCFQWMLAQKQGSRFPPPPGAVIHHAPRPLLLALVMYILPLPIIIFLLWGTFCEWIATTWQLAWK